MGMWVERFNSTRPVKYVHSIKFCQFGCIDDYYTAHYQSPRQMLCLWDKLQAGKAQCCNMRQQWWMCWYLSISLVVAPIYIRAEVDILEDHKIQEY